MRRREAFFALCFALAAVTAGLTWLLGPYGLTGIGVLVATVVLFVVDVKEDEPR